MCCLIDQTVRSLQSECNDQKMWYVLSIQYSVQSISCTGPLIIGLMDERGNNRKTKWRNWSLFLQCLDEFFGLFNLEAALQDRRRQTTLSTSIISQPRSSLFILYAIFFSPQKSECIFLRSLSNVHSHWGKHKAALAGKKKISKRSFLQIVLCRRFLFPILRQNQGDFGETPENFTLQKSRLGARLQYETIAILLHLLFMWVLGMRKQVVML